MRSKKKKQEKACQRKHVSGCVFYTPKAALYEAARMNRKSGVKVEAYYCYNCKHYHIGHSLTVTNGKLMVIEYAKEKVLSPQEIVQRLFKSER